MDWGRYLRAKDAVRVEAVEQERSLFFSQRKPADEIEAATWETIAAHDALLAALLDDEIEDATWGTIAEPAA